MDDTAREFIQTLFNNSEIVVGMGSISHNFDGALAISVFTDSNERVSNLDKGVPANVVDLAG